MSKQPADPIKLEEIIIQLQYEVQQACEANSQTIGESDNSSTSSTS